MLVKKIPEKSTPNQIEHLSIEERLVWLMEEYGDMVIRLAFTYVKQKQLAEDISQEVFISCYKNIDKFQNKATYKTWIYRITVNKCKDVLRSWSFKNLFYNHFISSLLMKGLSTETKMIAKEEKGIIFEKVLTLPIKLREVIILHYYEDLSINEIAELISLNSNTVKTRLYRGRSLLKNLFEKENISWKIN